MSFRKFVFAALLGCVALRSASSQDADPPSAPAGDPGAASQIPANSDSNPALQKFFNDGDAPNSPEALFNSQVAINRNSSLQQIAHKANGNCVGPACAPPAGNGCVPPPITNGAKECCDPCLLKHRHGVFADYLFLSATDVDLPYALPVDGLGPVNVLQGPAAIADNKYDSGFRVGGIVALDDATSVMSTFWWFQSSEGDQKFAPGGGAPFYLSTLTDPGTANVAADSLLTSAFYDIDFEMIDLVVRRAFVRTKTTMVNAVAGIRYAHLNQLLQADYAINGLTSVVSDIDFYGIGPRLGLEAEYVACNGFLLYGNAHVNFLAGTFDTDYRQDNVFAGSQSFVKYDDTRVVTQTELELGVGWQSKCGTFRFTAGYYMTTWHNALTTPVYIRGVQSRHLEDLTDRIGFNGLTVRAMVQF